jgi:hypothetical protein
LNAVLRRGLVPFGQGKSSSRATPVTVQSVNGENEQTFSSPGVPFDDKAHIRDELNLSSAQWRRAEPSDHVADGDAAATGEEENEVEFAFVPHTDGVTYVAMRQSSEPDGDVLIFTPAEWIAFIEGVKDNEFDWG